LFCVPCLQQYALVWKYPIEDVNCPTMNCSVMLSASILDRLQGEKVDQDAKREVLEK